MTDLTINVRLPSYHSPIQALISATDTPKQALQQIANDYHLKNATSLSLVISPTPTSSGGILDAHTPFAKFKLAQDAVLELWRRPFVINAAVQAPDAKPRDVKRIALDYSMPLVYLVPIIQNCFANVGLEEFGFQSVQLTSDGAASNAVWLNANDSLQAQRFGGENTLVVVPMDILAAMPARTLAQKADKEAWLLKESHKNGKLTPKKKRYCILRGSFLFYFKHMKDSQPAGVIPLEYYSVKKLQREPRGTFFVLRRTFRGFESKRADAFLFHAADAALVLEWFEAVRQRCVNVSDQLFGVPLERVVMATAANDNVPSFVRQCVRYLSQPDKIVSEGLFRLSGGAAAVGALKDRFDQAQEVALSDEGVDADTVAALLKTFFRELPEPLYPFEFYELMLRACAPTNTPAQRRFELLHTTSQLPRSHYDVLKYLVHFLHRVAQFSEQNKMTSENLGRVWSSNVLRAKTLPPDGGVADVPVLNELMTTLIDEHESLYHIDDKAPVVSRRRAPTLSDIVSQAPSLDVAGDDGDSPPPSPRISSSDEVFASPPRRAPPLADSGEHTSTSTSTSASASNSNTTGASAAPPTAAPPPTPPPRVASPPPRIASPPPATRRAVGVATLPRASAVGLPEAAAVGGVLKRGLLTKQGGNRKNWKVRARLRRAYSPTTAATQERFFALTPTCLLYFESEPKKLSTKAAKGTIAL